MVNCWPNAVVCHSLNLGRFAHNNIKQNQNARQNSWVAVLASGTPPPPRCGHVGFQHGNDLLIFGGYNKTTDTVYGDLWILSLSDLGTNIHIPLRHPTLKTASSARTQHHRHRLHVTTHNRTNNNNNNTQHKETNYNINQCGGSCSLHIPHQLATTTLPTVPLLGVCS